MIPPRPCPRLAALPLAAALTLGAGACKKTTEGGTVDPAPTEKPAGGLGPETDEGTLPPQEPAPQAVTDARAKYLLGDYAAAAELLAEVAPTLTEDAQLEAGAQANGWLALALARDVVENAEAPANTAVEQADRLGSVRAQTVAYMARGMVQLGLEDLDGAVASLEKAAGAGGSPGDAALARVLLGEALITRAYGAGGGSKLQNPQDLDAARKAYEQALADLPADDPDAAILQGRAHEGLAAVGKFQGNRDLQCEHAKAAADLYEQAGAADFLKEGPRALAASGRCS